VTTSTHPWQTDPMSELDDAAEAVDVLDEAVSREMEHISRESVELAVVDVEYRQLWDQQDGENGFQHQMFLYYRDLGLARTVTATHKHFASRVDELANAKIKTLNLNWLYQISTKQRWKERVYAWDQFEEQQYQLARSTAIREMVDRHEHDITDAIDGLMTPVRALQLRIDTDPDFLGNLSQASAAKLIDMANKASRTIPSLMNAERLARGMPTEVVGGTVEHKLIEEVDRSQIGAILEVLDRAGVLNDGSGDSVSGEVIDAEVVDVYPLPPEGDD
jgi:hypothetical protein